MSRSKKKTPIGGISTSTSEKCDKRYANRAYRRITRALCHTTPPDEESCEELEFPLVREVSDVWSFAKDGKVYNPPHPDYPHLMRK